MYNIRALFKELFELLQLAGLDTRALFLNPDLGLDADELRSISIQEEIETNIKTNPRNTKKDENEYQYFDSKLYEKRTVIEHENACLEGFKELLIRFETKIKTGCLCIESHSQPGL